jgi:mannan endo-1,4-beta-mannosidase
MKKAVLILTTFLLIGINQSALQAQPKAEVLAYIAGMKDKGTVLSGQHCGDGDNISTYFGTMMTGLYNLTGKYAAIVGADYGYKANNNLTTINSKLIEHWKAGGLVTISWHCDNPYVAGYDCRWNSVTNKATINFNGLLKSATSNAARTNYRTELEKVAVALQALKNAGVVVIWRPFHEMNGDWFWWGMDEYSGKQTNVKAYINLWKDMYDTFTTDYGLTNLIWVYSPNSYSSWAAPVTAYYPGSDYVDIVGEDVYSAVGGLPDFTRLSSFGKPIVLTECGPNSANYGKYDEFAMVTNIVGKTCYFLQWHSWTGAAVAIKDNPKASEMMNSEKVISLDEVDFSKTSTGLNDFKSSTDASGLYKLFPNPTNDVVNIEWRTDHTIGLSGVKLFNLNGSLIKKESFSGNNFQLNISYLEPGIYILSFETKNGKMTKKIIKT